MAVVIAMLRGVNVAGHHKLSMEALRKHCTGLGFEDVQTYIQSGNLVFRDSGDPATLARRLEDGIKARFVRHLRCCLYLTDYVQVEEYLVWLLRGSVPDHGLMVTPDTVNDDSIEEWEYEGWSITNPAAWNWSQDKVSAVTHPQSRRSAYLVRECRSRSI